MHRPPAPVIAASRPRGRARILLPIVRCPPSHRRHPAERGVRVAAVPGFGIAVDEVERGDDAFLPQVALVAQCGRQVATNEPTVVPRPDDNRAFRFRVSPAISRRSAAQRPPATVAFRLASLATGTGFNR